MRPTDITMKSKSKPVISLTVLVIVIGTFPLPATAQSHGEPCTLLNGESHMILNMEESRGNDISQGTNPSELPISGTPGQDMELELMNEEENKFTSFFKLSRKTVSLVRPLDRDHDDLSSVMVQVTCTILSTGKRKTIPLVITISDINDNAPKFVGDPYSITIPESIPVNTTVFKGLKALDPDSNVNGQVEFRILDEDADPFFTIDLPHQGLIKVAKKLDYESAKNHYVTIVASDRALDPSLRYSVTTTLTVNIMDSDDQNPKFTQSAYTAKITSGVLSGALEVLPEKLKAEDQDTLRSNIQYSFTSGKPNFYKDHFRIDPKTGVVTQTEIVEKSTVDQFEIEVKAEELSENKRLAKTKLTIEVMAEDINPPILAASSLFGFVKENSAIGTKVQDKNGNAIQFFVTDKDRDSSEEKVSYEYEMTSSAFRVDPEGFLVVNDPNLDRDAPNEPTLSFQIFARETEGQLKTSAPLSLTVKLLDENDNSPILQSIKDVTLAAGNTRRTIAKLNATDNDSDKLIRYRLVHVSNNGKKKFSVNAKTGEVSVIAPVKNGEHFSLTISAEDRGGKQSQGIMEVRVTKGPNLRGPVFDQFLYEAPVSEGAAKFSSVVTASARDPEGGKVRYSIISGNTLEHFQIEESTGVIRVMQPLDREQLKRYSLTVRAEDSGGKYSTATVNIIVKDINDQNPRFVGIPYSFRVVEGQVGAVVGAVAAEDDDVDDNAAIFYSVPDSSPFVIDAIDGEIRTKSELDFESQPVHYVVVTASDRGKEPRIATATVTVLVQDTADEVPIFPTEKYRAEVPENVEDFLITTVQAEDLDSESSITYRLVKGDLDKFSVNPVTGVVRTLKGLDFERQRLFTLVIGTEEALRAGALDQPGTTCEVDVTVQDRNDNPPVFTRVPRGNVIDIRNDGAIGDVIGYVRASDSDGSSPGNLVLYQISEEGSSERAKSYFDIDRENGQISIKDDLTKEVFDEYRLEIKAYDKGDPSLSSSIIILVRVRQVVTVPPDSGVGFAQLENIIQVPESVQQGKILGTLSLVQKPTRRSLRITCEILKVTDSQGKQHKGLFLGRLNSNQDCEILMNQGLLDRETNDSYEVEMRLNTLSAYANPKRMKTKVKIVVQDENDNPPRFVYDDEVNNLIKDQYLVAIQDSIPVDQEVFQLKAEDKDSGEFGEVQYILEGGNLEKEYFSVDPVDGKVKNIKTFEDLDPSKLPFELIVQARDNPNNARDSHSQRTMLVINLLKLDDGIVLSISDTSTEKMAQKRAELVDLLQEQTGLVVTVDKMVPAMVPYSNGTCCKMNSRGTDVYFHVTDPNTNEILGFNSDKVQRTITSKQAASDLKYTVSGRLGVQASEFHEPYSEVIQQESEAAPIKTSESSYQGFPAALIAFGCLVFALALAAMVYLCVIKRRLRHSEDKTTKTIVIPRYEPVFVEPNLKEYETQVLQMSVTIDDQENVQRNSRHQPISLDSISYITKDRLSLSASPGGSEKTRTTNSSFELENPDHYTALDGENQDPITPIRNPLFPKSDTDEGLRHLSASHTNANVLFGAGAGANASASAPQNFLSSTPIKSRKLSQDEEDIRSPIDTTTQL